MDGPAVGFNNSLADGKAQPNPAAALGMVQPVKLIEHFVQLIRGDTQAAVHHLNAHRCGRLARGAHIHRRAQRGILGGVIQQVNQHLLDEHKIHHNRRQVFRHVGMDGMAGQAFSGARQAGADQVLRVGFFQVQAQLLSQGTAPEAACPRQGA